MKLTAYYTVRNEEEFLPLSLQSILPSVDEVVIYDCGSTDKTPEIAKDFGARYERTEDTFLSVGQDVIRHRALAMCSGDWILQLDGDCVLGPGWRAEFDQKVNDEFGWASLRFWEHVGSYEFIHRTLQQNRIGAFFRRHEGLKFTGGNEKRTHGSLIPSALPAKELQLASGWYHYGYAKADITTKFRNNILRGDWAIEPEVQAQYLKLTENEIWERMPAVRPVPYSDAEIPIPIRPLFNKTYDLVLADNWKILERKRI